MALNFALAKKCIKKQTKNQNCQNVLNFGDLTTAWITILFCVVGTSVITKLNFTHPNDLKKFPNSILIFYIHIVNPTLMTLSLAVRFLSKSKELQKIVKKIIPKRSVPVVPIEE